MDIREYPAYREEEILRLYSAVGWSAYTNDPAQEAQGLNSVFATDTTTLDVIRTQVDRMSRVK